ncbi:hypothetical protein CJ030_MR6G020118 [Morella rubra]|uniref:Uncharacterized protein n=1 Tax=Morella rubra TaxID=262757 RepID=A0A6A1VB08_9ROSI|nr:hypothetical protein CJ030_MR6G020118 [Morella rubra]
MKTVSGKILSQKPVSLKKATSILSKFATADNGASPAISAYLRRSLASFKELRHVEKELGAPRSDRKHKRPKPEIVSEVDGVRKKQTRTVASDRETAQGVGVNLGEKDKREKRGTNEQKDELGKIGDNGGEAWKSRGTGVNVKIEVEENPGRRDEAKLGMESERKKHKKKKKKKKKKDGDYVDSLAA